MSECAHGYNCFTEFLFKALFSSFLLCFLEACGVWFPLSPLCSPLPFTFCPLPWLVALVSVCVFVGGRLGLFEVVFEGSWGRGGEREAAGQALWAGQDVCGLIGSL